MEFTGAQGRSRDVRVVSGVMGRSGETRRGQRTSIKSREADGLSTGFCEVRGGPGEV